jgi:5-carboxymethyl-2-hydroxymuconate isomerase
MPHLVIVYSNNFEKMTDMTTLCRRCCDAMLAVKDETGAQVFPTGGTRVLAYPAAHFAIADGKRDYAFAYFNARMARGRSEAVKQAVGDAIRDGIKAHLGTLFDEQFIGITVQVDEGHEVYDAKMSSIHPLFKKT